MAELEYEQIEFGTSTRPGGVFRRTDGEYAVYKSDRKGVLVNWSTNHSVLEGLNRVRLELPELHTIEKEEPSMLMLKKGEPVAHGSRLARLDIEASLDEGVDVIAGDASRIVHAPGSEILKMVDANYRAISMARIAFKGVTLLWREPYLRFFDSQTPRAELGVYLQDYSRLPELRTAMRSTAEPGFMELGQAFVTYREKGNVKRFKL